MAKVSENTYNDQSISSLKGADRVRKRPGVIFGSDGVEGCQHAVFEILSNAIDEAREGYGDRIIITRFADASIEIEDYGRGIPVEYNEKEERYNWELLFCELYAGGKFNTNEGESYEYSLGLNGLGLCATQYASEYMTADIYRDKKHYSLRFKKGENEGGLFCEQSSGKRTGTVIRWRPDIEVFTDIEIMPEYFYETLKRQAVVNPGITFIFKMQTQSGDFEEKEFFYANGIQDYVSEIAGDEALTPVQFWQADRKGRDREDKSEYKVKLSAAFCFSVKVNLL